MEAVISIKKTEVDYLQFEKLFEQLRNMQRDYDNFKVGKDKKSDVQQAIDKAITYQPPPAPTTGPAAGNGYEVLLQQFNWESKNGGNWLATLKDQAKENAEQGISAVWLPPCTNSVSREGYLPRDLYDFQSSYGSESDLRECIKVFKEYNIKVIADIVINHRCASQQKDGVWNQFGGRMAWDESAICQNNRRWQGKGGWKTGDDYVEAPNVDHTNQKVQEDLSAWLNHLKGMGFDGWRFDYVKGYGGQYARNYINNSAPQMAFGEYWDSCDYQNGVLSYNQDNHRQRIINWIDATGGTAAAFDFTTKGILQEAIYRTEYWRLVDNKGRPPGVLGMWPSRAITFLENHDTGSTLNHWPFPQHGLQQGYAYLLTHPGTPCVFYDHYWSQDQGLRTAIRSLLKVRKDFAINYKSKVDVKRAHNQVYSCVIDDKICMKIGPGDWHPSVDKIDVGQKEWCLECCGHQFAVWSAQK